MFTILGISVTNGNLVNVVVQWVGVLLRILDVRFQILAKRQGILNEVFLSFPQSLQENSGIVPQIWPRTLSSTYLIDYLPTMLPFDAV
jgi:hypothetical protein